MLPRNLWGRKQTQSETVHVVQSKNKAADLLRRTEIKYHTHTCLSGTVCVRARADIVTTSLLWYFKPNLLKALQSHTGVSTCSGRLELC